MKSNINVVFCVINTTILNTLLERFHYIKIARFTILARITTTVLICILPRVTALVLVAMSGAIFTILPTANYIIMLPAVRYYNRKVEDGFIAAIARNTMTREESCQGHVYYFCCSCHLCDSKNFGCFLFSVVWKPLPQFFPMVHNFIAAEFEYYSQARSCAWKVVSVGSYRFQISNLCILACVMAVNSHAIQLRNFYQLSFPEFDVNVF